jgi:homoserine kinase
VAARHIAFSLLPFTFLNNTCMLADIVQQCILHKKKVTIKVPATIANMVCGFDILGFAVNAPFDEMEMQLVQQPGIQISHFDDYGLPETPEQNVAGVSLIPMLEAAGVQAGLKLCITKNIKPGSGLGSSAASAAGAVLALNALLNNYFDNDDLIRFAMHGEKLASGVKHADNIAPCIYGGVTLVRSAYPLDVVALPAPGLFVTIIHPQIELRTADARSVLKQQLYLKDAIKQWGNIAGLVAGIMKNDHALIGRSLVDVVIEPARSILIPGFDDMKTVAKNAGALGGGIAGSGPAVFMLSSTEAVAVAVETAMKKVCTDMQLDHRSYVTTINQQGALISIS